MERGPRPPGGEAAGAGLPSLFLDPEAQVSPYALFRALREGQDPLLVDVREERGTVAFLGAETWGGPDWTPPAGRDVVLVDDDGAAALALARRLRAVGHRRVRSLFGGLRLYDHALDPAVVGDERFLEERLDGRQDPP